MYVMCNENENSEYDEKGNSKEYFNDFNNGFVNVSKPTTFGFLYVLNYCVSKEGFK